MCNVVKCFLYISNYSKTLSRRIIYAPFSHAVVGSEQTVGQRVMRHGSNGSTNVNGSHGSRVLELIRGFAFMRYINPRLTLTLTL